MTGYDEITDVPLSMRAELDNRTISVRALLDWEEGSVLELSRPAGENVDVFAGDIYIGSGEILVMDGALAIRLSDIASDGGAEEQ